MNTGIKILADNRHASFEYFLEDRYEAGIELKGTEIKSIRKGSCNIKDSYVTVKNGQALIINMNIPVYDKGNIFNHDPVRTRRLLLHKSEIKKMLSYVQEKGYTLIPTKIYLKDGLAKLEFALAKGKKNYDKREVEKQKSIAKDLNTAKRDYSE